MKGGWFKAEIYLYRGGGCETYIYLMKSGYKGNIYLNKGRWHKADICLMMGGHKSNIYLMNREFEVGEYLPNEGRMILGG